MEACASSFAKFLRSVETSDAMFFPASSDASDRRSLTLLLGLSDQEFVCLMGALALGQFNKRHKNFVVSKDKLDVFLVTCSLGDVCETVEARYKGKSRQLFIKVGRFPPGVEHQSPGADAPSDRQLPDIVSLREKQEMFKKEVAAILQLQPQQAATRDNNTDSTRTANQPTQATEEDHVSNNSSNNQQQTEESFVKACLERKLFPLLFSKHVLGSKSLWLDDIDLPDVAKVITQIAQDLVAKRQVTRASIIKSTMMSPVDASLFPTFAEFGIAPTNKSVIRGLLRDIVTLDAVSGVQHNLLKTEMSNGQDVTLVRVPQCVSLDRLERNDRLHGFVGAFTDALIVASVKAPPPLSLSCTDTSINNNNVILINNQANAVLSLLVHLGKRNKDEFRMACERMKVAVRLPLDEIATFAMWSSANVNYSQQREIARHLRVWYGRGIVCPEDRVKGLLGQDFVRPEVVGVFRYLNVNIPWSARSPSKVLRHYLNGLLNTKDKSSRATIEQITHIDCLISLDHGQGFCRAVAVFICRSKKDEQWTETQDTFILGQAECAKDDATILTSTFLPTLDAGFQEIQDKPELNVYRRARIEQNNQPEQSENPLYVCLKGDEKEKDSDVSVYPIKLECHCAADIKQYMMNQGRGGYASSWCPYCDVSHTHWQLKSHRRGTPWTLARLEEHSATVHEKMTPAQRRGVDGKPILKSIPLKNYTPPRLHIALGAGNGVGKNVVKEVQAACEKWSPLYVELERKVARLTHDVGILRKWKKADQGIPKNRITELGKKEGQNQITETEKVELDHLVKKAALNIKHLEESKDLLDSAKKLFENESKQPENTKAQGQSIRAAIEDIWKSHGIDKGAYFGGDAMIGEGTRILMGQRDSISGAIKEMILNLPEEQKKIKEARIWMILDLHTQLLGHLDSLFSICTVRRFHLTNQQEKDAVGHRDRIMALWRGLGISVTIKLHIIEDHIVDHLLDKKGFGDLTEDEGERAHQTGNSQEARSKNMKDSAVKATSHARWEAMSKNAQVRQRNVDVTESVKRKRRLNGKEDNAKKHKAERDSSRAHLLDHALVDCRYETLEEEKKRMYIQSGPVRTDPMQEDFVID
jgi:hypothetical protein